MTPLSRSRSVKCPYVRAIAYFDRHFRNLPVSERGEGRVMRLRTPLSALGLGDTVALDRDVVARLGTAPEPAGMEHGIKVEWEPEGGGPFPTFQGSLAISADTPKSSTISLDGAYEPPLGAVGKVFDAVVGRRIAEATADELLKVLGEKIELEYMTDEPHLSR
jgi:hypothetical protein